jgi:phage repressor protein C with HTH and peptisase S24 domain
MRGNYPDTGSLDEYPDERLDADQLKQVKVIGKVFWYSV